MQVDCWTDTVFAILHTDVGFLQSLLQYHKSKTLLDPTKSVSLCRYILLLLTNLKYLVIYKQELKPSNIQGYLSDFILWP